MKKIDPIVRVTLVVVLIYILVMIFITTGKDVTIADTTGVRCGLQTDIIAYAAAYEVPEKEETVVEEVEAPPTLEELRPASYTVLTRSGGVNYFNGLKETYYNLPMQGVIRLLNSIGIYGNYWVREDGVKMYGDYVMVAADTYRFPKGTVLQTSLGMAMIVDHCEAAASYPGVWIDVAVEW